MNYYRKRVVDELLSSKLEAKGAVLIEGPKWCGKTTTALQQAKSVLRMDNPLQKEQNLRLSKVNPQRLLNGDNPRLIDEWQIAPTLWDTVRYEVDQRGKMGQFILTGSAVPVETKEITHSGTGRFTWLTMRPMSLYESEESTGEVSLKALFNGNLEVDGESDIDIDKLAFLVCRGGWPQALDLKPKAALRQAFDYFDAVVKSDINRADGVTKNPERVKRIMRSYARNQGSQIACTVIANDIEVNETETISEDTIHSYLEALKKIFVVEDMPAWNPNLRSKSAIRTSDTRYFVDPSIATASLGIGPEDLINDLKTFGLMFETMCVRDLRIFADSLDGNVYHYRDNTNLECDTVIHLRNGSYGLIEIKLGGNDLIDEGASNLIKLKEKIDSSKMKEPSFLMVLVGVGQYAYTREDGVLVVPIGCLKN
ncbi:MAG: ATP-binding protein [Sphaerochaetaceae bacterium]|nr:ATP-binding protein [Sphaerochaetaceae bacterium]